MIKTSPQDMHPHPRRLALLLVLGSYVAAALGVDGATYRTMLVSYMGQVLYFLPLVLLVLLVRVALSRPALPVTAAAAAVTTATRRLALPAAALCAGLAAYSTLKLAIPAIVPFYLDGLLADLDVSLHGGNPGEMLHALLPDEAAYPILVLYGPVWACLWFGVFIFASLQPDDALRDRFFWTMTISFILLGTLLATALSSVGPIFYERVYEVDRFAGLVAQLETSIAGDAMASLSDFLFRNYSEDGARFGTGISAMPSVHLLVVTLNACFLGSVNRLLGVLSWVYVACILAGSVYLGWHYALDGYVSITVVSFVWWAAGHRALSGAARTGLWTAGPRYPASGVARP